METDLNNIVKISKENYEILLAGGEVGGYTYDENSLYLIEDEGSGGEVKIIKVSLNKQWVKSDRTLDGYSLYMSDSNRGIHNSTSAIKITFAASGTYNLYINAYGESSCDYTVTLEKNYEFDSDYSSHIIVQYADSTEPTSIDNFKKVTYEASAGDFVYIVYKKDGSVNNYDDRGYLAIPDNVIILQNETEGGVAEVLFEEPVTIFANYDIKAKSISDVEASLAYTSADYTGQALTPAVTVKDGQVTLNADADYTVAYQNNVEAGKATVTITGQGNYTGIKTLSFTIKGTSIEDAKVTLSYKSAIYSGTAKKPVVKVIMNSKTLVKDTDYIVKYSNNKNAGTATVTVTGIGAYAGVVKKTFSINPKELVSNGIKLSKKSYAYTGKERNPSVTVTKKVNGEMLTLKKDRDYTVKYQSSSYKIGTHTVTVKGKGNFTGTFKKSYKVIPEKATGLKFTSGTGTGLKFSCVEAKDSGCKYQFVLYQYDPAAKEWVKVSSKKKSAPSVSFSDLASGTGYKVQVRYSKTVDEKNYYGNYSSAVKVATTPNKPVISYASKTGSSTMKVTWAAISGSATGYEIQYSRNSDFSGSKIKTVKGVTTTSANISDLYDASYYARVRAYKTVDGTRYYSGWSSSVSTYYSNVYASYTTTYNSGNYNRTTNLQLATRAINGTIIQPGGIFSFNGVVGERTAAKGYKEAIIYEGGREVGGIGGGICQIATTMFNAALKANFGIVERYQHSLTVHYVPYGYDAAIAWGSKNFRFSNNCGYPIKIEASASGGYLSIKYLTNVYKKPPAVTTKVTVSNKVYTLKRYVDGVCNYTTTSKYQDL